MGGRGSSGKSGGGGSASPATINTKYTAAQLNSMARSELETVARAVFIKQNTARGLTVEEANYRARALMNGNTTSQLRKYIKRYG